MKKPFNYSIVAIAIAIVLLFSFCLVCRYDAVPVLINKTETSICVITSTSRKLVSDNEEQLKERKNYSQMCVDFHHILLPLVNLEFDNDTQECKADVYCCYWNNWAGLVRDHVVIVIKDNSIMSYSQGNKLVLYKYNCGIKY